MKTNEKFRLIFNGLEIAYGQYIPGKNSENGKLGGQAFTKREPLTRVKAQYFSREMKLISII